MNQSKLEGSSILSFLLVLALVFSIGPQTALAGFSNAQAIYVSPAGNDSNAGTFSAPYETLEKAFQSLTGDGVIYVMGNLTLNQTIILNNDYHVLLTSSDTSGNQLPNAEGDYNGVHTIIRGPALNDIMFRTLNGQGEGSFTIRNVILDGGSRVMPNDKENYILYTSNPDFTVNLQRNSALQNNINTGNSLGSSRGGAADFDYIKELNISENAVIRGNVAPRHGGALTVYGGTINMSGNASIYGNGIEYSSDYSAYFGGSAILIYGNSSLCTLNITGNASITNNYINLNGGSDFGRPHAAVMALNEAPNAENIYIADNARIFGNRDISTSGSFTRSSWTLAGGSENNLFAEEGHLFVPSILGSNAKMGITLKNAYNGANVAAGTNDYTITNEDISHLFYDGGGYSIVKSNNYAVLSDTVLPLTLQNAQYNRSSRQVTGELSSAVDLNTSEVTLMIDGIAQDRSTYSVSTSSTGLTVTTNTAISSGAVITLEITKNGYQPASATTTVAALPAQSTPQAGINYPNEVLSNLEAGSRYIINGVEKTADASGNIAIDSSWMGQTLSVVKKGDSSSTVDSEAQLLTLPERPSAPGNVGSTHETVLNATDGTLTGVNTSMEYRSDASGSWTSVTGEGSTVTGLAPDAYAVRIRATESAFASNQTELVIHPVGTVVLNTNGGTVNSGNVTSHAYGTAVSLPVDVTKANAAFAGWYANADFSGAPVTWIAAAEAGNLTYYAKWLNAPAITTQPGDTTAPLDGIASLSVTADSGAEGITYQWQRLLDNQWIDIDQATSSSLSINHVSAADDGAQFRCMITKTMEGTAISVPSASATLHVRYPVTVNTRTDGAASVAPGTIELKQGGVTKAVAASTVTIGTYSASLPNGAYSITINGQDTGKAVTVSGGAVTADSVDYYSVSFSAANSGLAAGSTVIARIGEMPLASGSTVLEGTRVILAAAGANATSYTYLWSGSGTNGQTTSEITLSVTDAVYAICTVTGSSNYSIIFNTGGGVMTGSTVTDYTYGSLITLPTDITLPNAAFAGWYTNADFSGELVTQLLATDTGNKFYYAKWVNTVVFNQNYPDASVFAVRADAVHGAALEFDQTPVRTGYIFAGWYKDKAGLDPWSFANDTVAADMTLYARWITAAYDITGTVMNDAAPAAQSVSGAVIKLMQGNTQFGETALSDENGRFQLTGIPNGTYNLVAAKDGKVETVLVTVKDGSYNFGAHPIIIPTGNKSSILNIKGNDTPSIVVDGLNNQFTSDNLAAVHQGDAVKITMEIESRDSSAPGASELQSAAYGKSIDLYLDMTVLLQINNHAPTALSTVPNLMKIIIPYSFSGKSNVAVYRYHDTAAQLMQQLAYSANEPASEGYMLNAAENQIIIWAQNFSIYAVAYTTGSGSSTDSGSATDSGFAGTASYSITVPVELKGGSISPNGVISVATGGSKTFTITPDKGYSIADVLVDGKSVGAVSSYTLANITATHTISVVFSKNEATSLTAAGLPYYLEGNNKVFIGFASNASGVMKYLAQVDKTVLFQDNPKSFADIAAHWGKPYIDFVTEREIFEGTDNKVFSPDTGMTRAMLAAVMGRLYERSYGPLQTKGAHVFTDSSYDSWYGRYIDWCAEMGIVQGVSASQFEPDRNVTREEMAAMLLRFAQLMKLSTELPSDAALSYSDSSSIAPWAKTAALYSQETGIITGRDGGSFAPKATATRAEVAVILKRFIELAVK